ncbi:hypothetical protein ABEW90_00435 [Bacillus subtilis]|jgi:hypothetical protein|nr:MULTISPECIES: hypothetical protein [Bacillus]MBU8569881.1 hypothetical protein [Bacillus subtilis]MBU8622698.1 hypothetical protein [Bacillus subtilis]MBU8803913.1 hypothetical protein [Bacillus subtilis]MCP6732579.1 hypothetical protein [Bacillus subtilis]MCV2514854.1 hypothetical protein [Bacillus subtilis]
MLIGRNGLKPFANMGDWYGMASAKILSLFINSLFIFACYTIPKLDKKE